MLSRAAFYSPFVLHPTRAAAASGISKLLRTTLTHEIRWGRGETEGAAGVVNQANENRFLNDIELIFAVFSLFWSFWSLLDRLVVITHGLGWHHHGT